MIKKAYQSATCQNIIILILPIRNALWSCCGGGFGVSVGTRDPPTVDVSSPKQPESKQDPRVIFKAELKYCIVLEAWHDYIIQFYTTCKYDSA